LTATWKLIEREEPLDPKRVMSVFRDRIEKHKEEIAELEEHEKIIEKEKPVSYSNLFLKTVLPEILLFYRMCLYQTLLVLLMMEVFTMNNIILKLVYLSQVILFM